MSWTNFVHRRVWQQLPRNFRRRLLFRTASWLAPQPGIEANTHGPVIVAGLLRTASGLGEGARLSYCALASAGRDVRGIDLSSSFPELGAHVEFPFLDGTDVEGPGTIMLHISGPFVPIAMMRLGRRVIAGKKIIGYWVWELPGVPSNWSLGLRFVHEIWVPTRFVADVITPMALGKPVRVVPHPVAARPISCTGRHRTETTFTALLVFNMASGFTRKNPLASIQAFKEAFGEDRSCRLSIRIQNSDEYSYGYSLIRGVATSPNIEVLDTSDLLDMDGFYASGHVVLSLHRSEGFGLIIAEAMLRGLPVIATNWSGNVDFLNSENGMPISYSLVSAFDPQGTYDYPEFLWAEPNISEASEKLRLLRDNPQLRVDLGRRAARDASYAFSVHAYSGCIKQSL